VDLLPHADQNLVGWLYNLVIALIEEENLKTILSNPIRDILCQN
jgi:hypothetical protein